MDRIKFFWLGILLVALAIVIRLFYWQFIANLNSPAAGSAQEEEIPAKNGEIFASDGFPLSANQPAFLLWGRPNEIEKNPKEIAKALAPSLISEKYATVSASLSEEEEKKKKEETKSKEEEIEKKIAQNRLFWVLLARKLPENLKEDIENLKIKGLGFEKDDKRFYPEASMAAHVLGFRGSDKFGKEIGYFGLEGYFDKQIRGKPGKAGGFLDPLGFPILVGRYRRNDPKPGAAIYTTLDRVVQFTVEEKLRLATEKYGAKQGSVIVADPKTGSILAMATYPSYNPSFYYEYDQDIFKNPVVADTYEPGSTFKLITMAAALDLSVVSPATICNVCSGPREIGGFEISTWNKKYYPNSTMTDVITHSDNVGMTFVSEKLGLEKFYSYILKFGFGSKTKITLQEEVAGSIREKEQWRPIDLATASFGQGIAVTPIQMIQAVSAIANKGQLIPPQIVTKIIEDGQTREIKHEEARQVVSQKTAAQITEMMINAVENGEAKVFKPKGYLIAGKTGTAQIPVEGHYDPNKTIASFIGFAPAHDPKFIMLVRFTEPTSSTFGSETAAPTFFEIARDLFNYYSVSPS